MTAVTVPPDMPESETLLGQYRLTLERSGSHSFSETIHNISVTFFGNPLKVRVVDEHQQSVGFFLGTIIDDRDGLICQESIQIDINQKSIAEWVESEIYSLSGSFVFVLDYKDEFRIYLDASGTKPIVFDRSSRKVGSSPAAILSREDYIARFDENLYQGCGLAKDGWLPAGLTAHRGIERLMCNHYLDLKSMEPHRHWGLAPWCYTPDVEGCFAQIAAGIAASMSAISSNRKVAMSLTAGNETRLLLACCANLLDKLAFFTVDAPGSALDTHTARILARRFALNHRVLDYVKATPEQQALWLYRAGHQVAGMNLKMHPSVWPLADAVCVGGLGGEVGRGFLWPGTRNPGKITSTWLIDRLKLPRHPELIDRIEQWLTDLPVTDPLQVLDMAYIELRMGSWAFAQEHSNPMETVVHPLISRRMFELMLSLPPDVRRHNGLIIEVIRRKWPALLDVPINRYGDCRDRLVNVRRGLANPHRIYRKAIQGIRNRLM